jgi:hypothetical protein
MFLLHDTERNIFLSILWKIQIVRHYEVSRKCDGLRINLLLHLSRNQTVQQVAGADGQIERIRSEDQEGNIHE